jgi:hypothetical protein
MDKTKNRILNYLSDSPPVRLVKYIAFKQDVSRCVESLKRGLGKEYRIDNDVTVGTALDNIIDNLDAVFCGRIANRLPVINAAVDELGLHKIRQEKVRGYIPLKYLRGVEVEVYFPWQYNPYEEARKKLEANPVYIKWLARLRPKRTRVLEKYEARILPYGDSSEDPEMGIKLKVLDQILSARSDELGAMTGPELERSVKRARQERRAVLAQYLNIDSKDLADGEAYDFEDCAKRFVVSGHEGKDGNYLVMDCVFGDYFVSKFLLNSKEWGKKFNKAKYPFDKALKFARRKGRTRFISIDGVEGKIGMKGFEYFIYKVA